MPINEIEIQGSSIGFKVFKTEIENHQKVFNRIMQEGEQFDIENETPGFHDCETDGEIIRGYYSGIIPFVVEHLVEGLNTKTLLKRTESVEFVATRKNVFCNGKPGPAKGLYITLSGLTGSECSLIEFDFHQLHQLQNRFAKVKSIVLANPKEKEVRRARLAGHIESYEDYNIIDPRNHGIESVSGVLTTPMGAMTITVSKKGCLRLGVQKGLIITTDLLDWLMCLILENKDDSPNLFNFNSEF